MAKPQSDKTQSQLDKFFPWLLLVGGLVALLASMMLSIEVFNRLKDPNYIPVCNLNPVLSCTSVADSAQSHLFGFPNYFIGIAGYAAVATIGFAMLAGAKFKRWFWQTVQAGMSLAFIFITWLQFQTLYRIGALCIFCMVTWVATGPLFWYTSIYNLDHGHVKLGRFSGFSRFAKRYHGEILLCWFLLIILLILKRFWYYWSGLV